MSILEVDALKKTYTTRFGGSKVEALKNVSFRVEEGEYVAIMGESGSGKTTLLNILAALDKPTGGSVRLDGKDLSKIKESSVAAFRRDNLGFVFQDFNLLDTFSLEDNIYLPLVLAGKNPNEMKKRIMPIAETLGIADLLKKYPYEVSGGQKQRAAVARAIITNPRLILADEPTGALDSKATDELLGLFRKINESGQTVLMVTHSVKAASHAGRVLFIKDGEVFHQIYKGDSTENEFYQKISQITMITASANVLMQRLMERKLDLIISNDFAPTSPRLFRKHVINEPSVVLLPKSFPWDQTIRGGAEHVLTWADLRYCGLPMVQYWKETGAGKVNDLFFRTIGAQFPERIVVDTNALLVCLVKENLGWALSRPTTVLENIQWLPQIEVVPCPEPVLSRQVFIIGRESEFTNEAEYLSQLCQSVIHQQIVPEMLTFAPWIAEAMSAKTKVR